MTNNNFSNNSNEMDIIVSGIVINDEKHTIEITKKLATSAKHFGTKEYKALQEVRRDYPKYRVEVKTVARKTDCFKGLTFDYMEKYIRKHNDGDTLANFFTLCGKTEDGEAQEFSSSASYGEIKKWFLEQFPELNIKFKRDNINAILNKKVA